MSVYLVSWWIERVQYSGTKYIIIERSVKFDEPLQEVELVKEKNAEFPSYSTEYLDDEIGGDDPDLDPLISDISV